MRAKGNYLLWAMLFLYAAGRILQLYSAVFPSLAIIVLHVLPPAVFAVFHASRIYGRQGSLAFAVLCLGTGCFFESLSLRTGFPFGHYYFTDLMGPKIFQLPVLLALAYLGMGYASWILSVLMVGSRSRLVPGIAAFVMVAWDLSMEPTWATVDRAWIWRDGGTYFGVPVSNFLGWYLTAFIFYELFARYLRNREPLSQPASYWRLPVYLYALSALGNLLLAIPATTAIHFSSVIQDASGKSWVLADIVGTYILISLFVMLPLALVAWARTGESGDAQFASSSYGIM